MADTTVNVTAEAQRVLAAAGADPFASLGLARDAEFAEIKAKYKQYARCLHPDKTHGNALAAEAFAVVSAAFGELQARQRRVAAGTAAPLQSSQPEAPHGNRWQAFTGSQPHKQPQPQAQHPFPVATGGSGGGGRGGGSQENSTPGAAAAAGGGGGAAWPASKWGKHGGSNPLRAQPLAAAAAGAPGAAPAADKGSTHKQQRAAAAGAPAAADQHDSSESCSSYDTEGSASDQEAFEANWRPATAAVKPSAFYGSISGGRQSSPLVPPPAASLYGLFGGRRSSSGATQAAGWLSTQPDHRTQQPVQHPPAAAAAEASGSKWVSKSKLAELLKQPAAKAAEVAALACSSQSAVPRHGDGGSRQAEKQKNADGSSRQPKRRQEAVVSSSSSSGSSSGEEDSEDQSASEGEADSEPEPAAVSVKQQLTQALLRHESAARLAAQASGASFIQRGRDKALKQYRRKRQKKKSSSSRAAGGGGNAAGGSCKAADSSKAAAAGSGKAAPGSGKQQSKLQLTVVRPSLFSAALKQHAGLA